MSIICTLHKYTCSRSAKRWWHKVRIFPVEITRRIRCRSVKKVVASATGKRFSVAEKQISPM